MIDIDPGYAKRGAGCACARFNGRDLAAVWFARPEDPNLVYHDGVKLIVVEKPQPRRRDPKYKEIPAEVLINLMQVGAELAGRYAGHARARVEYETPSAWKGSTHKPQQHLAVWARLTAAERALLGGDETYRQIRAACAAGARDRWSRAGAEYYPDKWLTHNLLDAVAMGVLRLGR